MRLTSFCADMTQLTMKTRLSLTDICYLLDVTRQLAFTARQHQQRDLTPTTQQILHSLVKLLCKQLWTHRLHLTASHVAVTFTALSQTCTHPNTMPGLADALSEQFLADSECHNAYRYIQTLYACTQLGIDPSEGRLREHILHRFPKLSLAKATPRVLTNMLFAVTAQPAGPLSPAAADATALRTKAAHKLCTRLTRMLKSNKAEDQCTQGDMASSLASLRTLKHKPTDDFACAFASWFAQRLRQLQNELPPQISYRLVILFTACADLRLKLPKDLVPMLIPHIDGTSKASAKAAACAKSAWAAAALGILDIPSLELILHAHVQQPQSQLPWSVTDLLKLFQAVDWLQPDCADHPDQGRWRRLHDRVAAFGTRPAPGASAPPQQLLCALHAVLDEYSVAYSSNVRLGNFVAPAVAEAQGKQEGSWVFDFVTPADFFTNDPNRCVSSVVSACVFACSPCMPVQPPEQPLTYPPSGHCITQSAWATASSATSS